MIIILALLIVCSFCQDCIMTAIMSKYECSTKCQQIYGNKNSPTQRLFYNTTSMYCQPKVECPSDWTYISTNNTCVNDLGQRQNVINGAVLSSNVQNFTFAYVSCNDNGYFMNGSCHCNPGWNSSKTHIVIAKNTTNIQYCDIKIQPYNLFASKGQKLFNQYSWSQRRKAVNQIFTQGQKWVNVLVIVSLIVYSLVLILGIYHYVFIILKKKAKKLQKKQNKARN